jgi:hypothetical protein
MTLVVLTIKLCNYLCGCVDLQWTFSYFVVIRVIK